MNYLSRLIIVFFLIVSCNQKEKRIYKSAKTYPYSKKMDKKFRYYLRTNVGDGVSISAISDSLNLIHFLTFKKDSIIWKTKKNSILTSFTDAFKFSESYFLLKPNSRTLGKNHKSTYSIIKSDTSFNEIWRKELDIQNYPSAKSFILKKDSTFIYISNKWQMQKKEGLILREYNLNNKIIKERVLESSNTEILYRPVLIRKIEKEKFVAILDRSRNDSKNHRHSKYEITIFDFNFNIKSTKEVDISQVQKSVLLEKSKRLLIVDGYLNKEPIFHLYDIKGNFLKSFTIPKFNFYDVITDKDDNFFILGKYRNGQKIIIKYNKEGKAINAITIKDNNFPYTHLTSVNGIIYIYGINEKVVFKANKLLS
jgi:hypothetical protein